ncbi:MAG: chromate transporter [Candidatus Eremiobacteraeota bacterium]|nr:chromate transporter [Candidatus Eremiobacteraeota bacterium]
MRRRVTPLELFLGFAQLGLLSFGSALVFARRILVVERQWLDEREFAEIYGLGQALPGPNVGNVSVMIGAREAGVLGALAAITGFLLPPLIVVLALTSAILSVAGNPAMQGALRGGGAAAAGLVLGTGLAMSRRLGRDLGALALAALAFLGIAIAGFPLYAVVLAIVPLGLGLATWRSRRRILK